MNYNFHNLCGSLHSGGDVTFHSTKKSLFSAVGNRVISYDLDNSSLTTLPAEHRDDINRIVVSHDGLLILSIDASGQGLVQSVTGSLLHRFNFKNQVHCCSWSPDNRFLAVSFGRLVRVYKTPPPKPTSPPFVLLTTITGHTGNVRSLSWSSCSKYIVTGSDDCTARISPLSKSQSQLYPPSTFSAHRSEVIGAWFHESSIVTLAVDGAVCLWDCLERSDEDMHDSDDSDDDSVQKYWKLREKFIITRDVNLQTETNTHLSITSCSLSSTGMLAVGLNAGVFCIAELPSFKIVQTLSIGSSSPLTTTSISPMCDSVAFASESTGLLVVWDWSAECFLLKHSGSFVAPPTCVAYSKDSRAVVTGGIDGVVRVWSADKGTCIATLKAHSTPVASVCFSGEGGNLVVLSSSSDGTVKAHDVYRRKLFRVMTPEVASMNLGRVQADVLGDIVACASVDEFYVSLWQLRTGKILDSLGGHDGVISDICFSPFDGTLATCSLDKTARVWQIYARDARVETFHHSAECTAIAFSPNGKLLAVACLNGTVVVWDIEKGVELYTIDNKFDGKGGRLEGSQITASKASHDAYFTSVMFSADGQFLIGCGNSRWICSYALPQFPNELPILVERYSVTKNRNISGVALQLNSKNIETAERKEMKDAIAVSQVAFSPSNDYFVAASNVGLVIFKQGILGKSMVVHGATPDSVFTSFNQNNFGKSVAMACSLGEPGLELLVAVLKAVPFHEIDLVCQAVSEELLISFLKGIVSLSKEGMTFLVVEWLKSCFKTLGSRIATPKYFSAFREILKSLDDSEKLVALFNSNSFSLEFLC
ncbi:hypothetical protein GEMRC1_011167 [Eukaryota sp. GEM-RC1]